MNRQGIRLLYAAFGSKEYEFRSGWSSTNCPLAPWTHQTGHDQHPSFAVKESKGLSQCHCFSCGFSGELMELLYRIRTLHKNHPGVLDMDLKVVAEIIVKELENFELDFGNIPDYEEAVVKDSIFSEAWLATFMLATKSKDAMKYLESRDVPMQVIARMDIRFDPIQRRIGFPFRNAAGLVLGVQGRAINDDNPLRYYQYGYNGKRNAHAWLGEHWMDLDEPLVLVEGPFDVAKVMQVYGNVVASFTAGISVTKLKRIRDASEIITFYDFGKGGEAARSKIHQVMGKKVIADLIPTEEEDDPGNTPIDKIKEMLENYVSLE